MSSSTSLILHQDCEDLVYCLSPGLY